MKKESKRIVRQRETFDETGPIIYPRRHHPRFFLERALLVHSRFHILVVFGESCSTFPLFPIQLSRHATHRLKDDKGT
jgi:hypothetical protein